MANQVNLNPANRVNQVINAQQNVVPTNTIAEPPFQQFLDNAINSLNDISSQEIKTDQLINNYVTGKASLEEVILATNKLSLVMQLAVTVVNTAVQTFKEIQQMPV